MKPRIGRGVVLDVDATASLELGDGCVLEDGVRIHAREQAVVRIGAGAVLGERAVVLAHCAVEIGAGAVLGPDAVLIDFEHRTDDVETPVRLQGLRTAAVRVGDGARVGPRAVLERGTTVAPGGVVAPHAVVRAR
jgi:acetyltransferase-like isoleucine patch superfamily enzyme